MDDILYCNDAPSCRFSHKEKHSPSKYTQDQWNMCSKSNLEKKRSLEIEKQIPLCFSDIGKRNGF